MTDKECDHGSKYIGSKDVATSWGDNKVEVYKCPWCGKLKEGKYWRQK